MKALLYRKKSELSDFGIVLEDVPEPIMKSTDVLIRVKAVAINPGEAQMRKTIEAPDGGIMILGYEFAGVVEKAGVETIGLNVGDHIYGIGNPLKTGAYAELIAADYRTVHPLPSSLSFAQAAALPVSTITAWQAMFRQDNYLPKDVKSVLVIGAAGGVGSVAVQLLKARTSAKIIATASREESVSWLNKMGADIVVDHHGDVTVQLAGHGIKEVDFIFSVNGLSAAVGWISDVIRPYGYLSVIEGKELVDYRILMAKSVNIALETIFTKVMYGYDIGSQQLMLAELSDLVSAGKVHSTLTKSLNGLTVENIKEAHTLLEQGSVIGKIVMNIE